MIISIATLNTLAKHNLKDVCINKIGAGVAIAGAHYESETTTLIGCGIAGIGGGAAGYGLMGIAGILVVSNPIGWVVGGIAVGL